MKVKTRAMRRAKVSRMFRRYSEYLWTPFIRAGFIAKRDIERMLWAKVETNIDPTKPR